MLEVWNFEVLWVLVDVYEVDVIFVVVDGGWGVL